MGAGLGILAATVLLCTVPVFANTVSDIGLQQGLRSGDVVTRDLEVWNSWPVLLLFLALVSADCYLRKRQGLA